MLNFLKKPNKINRIALILSLFSILIPLAAIPLFAQTSKGRLDLTVSPPVIELTAKPGETLQEKFRVRNNLSSAINLQLSVSKLISDPVDGNPVPEDDTNSEEGKWISFSEKSFRALPNEWSDVNFTINIPESAAYGYYYVLRISPKDDNSVNSTGAAVKGEILVVILLNVKKEGAISKTELVSFKPKKMINEYMPVDFVTTLANKGNIHVKPRGNIFITRGGGKELAILDVNSGIGSILPGGKREFISSWTDGFIVKEEVIENGTPKIDKNGNPTTHLTINWDRLTSFRVGPYTAQLLMVYDDGTRDVTIEGTANFWVIPYTALLVMLIGIFILFFILRYILRWYVKREIRNSRK